MKWILVVAVLFSGNVFSQKLKLEKSEKLKADTFIGIDSYDHLYFVENNVIHKNGPLGKFFFNDLQLGPISSIDIINPLQVVVFYEDTNTVIFLDNRLNETERIGFNSISNPFNASMAKNAGNNQLWVFNIDTQQLELYNFRTKRRVTVSQPIEGDLIAMASNFNNCFLLNGNTLRQFNVYGSFISEEATQNLLSIKLNDDKIYFIRENNLSVRSEDKEEQAIMTPLELTIKDLYLSQEFLYIYDGNLLHTFTLTTPK